MFHPAVFQISCLAAVCAIVYGMLHVKSPWGLVIGLLLGVGVVASLWSPNLSNTGSHVTLLAFVTAYVTIVRKK